MALGGIRTVSDPSGANASVSSAVVADRLWQVLPVVLGARDPASALALARPLPNACGSAQDDAARRAALRSAARIPNSSGIDIGMGVGVVARACPPGDGRTQWNNTNSKVGRLPMPDPCVSGLGRGDRPGLGSSSTITIESVALLTDYLLHHAQGRLRPRTLGVIAAYRAVVISDCPVLVGGSDFICKALSACFQMSSSV